MTEYVLIQRAISSQRSNTHTAVQMFCIVFEVCVCVIAQLEDPNMPIIIFL